MFEFRHPMYYGRVCELWLIHDGNPSNLDQLYYESTHILYAIQWRPSSSLQPSSSSSRFGPLASCGSVVRVPTFPRMSYAHIKKPTQSVAWGPAPAPEDPTQPGRIPTAAVASSLCNKGRRYESVFPELVSTLATTSSPSPGLELAPLGSFPPCSMFMVATDPTPSPRHLRRS